MSAARYLEAKESGFVFWLDEFPIEGVAVFIEKVIDPYLNLCYDYKKDLLTMLRLLGKGDGSHVGGCASTR